MNPTFFENWLMKHKCPTLLKPLATVIRQNYRSFYPSESFTFTRYTMRHPVYNFVYSFYTTTYLTWEFAVWIIIITKLICWLVICFHLNAFQLWNNHLKHRKTKLHFQIPIFLLKIWPLLGKHIKKTVCMIIVNFLGFYKLLQFLTIFRYFGRFVDWRPDFE